MRDDRGVTTTGTTTGTSSPRVRSRPELALAGVLAGTAGLAVSLAVTSLLRLRLTPANAVAEAVIELTPGKVALELVHLLGRWDKPLLLAGVLELDTDPAPVNHAKLAVKLVIAAVVVLLVAKNRKFESIPKGLWGLITALTLANAAIAVFWG